MLRTSSANDTGTRNQRKQHLDMKYKRERKARVKGKDFRKGKCKGLNAWKSISKSK